MAYFEGFLGNLPFAILISHICPSTQGTGPKQSSKGAGRGTAQRPPTTTQQAPARCATTSLIRCSGAESDRRSVRVMRLQMRFGRRRETGLLAVLAAVSVSLSHGLLPPAMLAPARIAGPESVVNRASRLQLASSMGVRRGRRGRMRISASTLTVSGDVPNDPTSSSASEYMALLAKMPVASYQYNTVSTQSSKGGEEHIHKVQSHITPWMRSGELNAPGAFKPPPRQPSSTLQQSSTLLRGAAAGYGSSNSDAALRGIRVGDGIRCRSRVAVGHGIASRSRMDILGQGAGSIGRTGALPALLSKLYRATLNTVKSPARHINLDLSKSYIQRIREEVSASYQEGQRAMTQMGHLLTKALTPGAHECRSTVCAELWESPLDADGAEGAQEKTLTRFSLSQSVAPDQVQTRLIANHLLSCGHKMFAVFVAALLLVYCCTLNECLCACTRAGADARQPRAGTGAAGRARRQDSWGMARRSRGRPLPGVRHSRVQRVWDHPDRHACKAQLGVGAADSRQYVWNRLSRAWG
jgi:hypothetical protein